MRTQRRGLSHSWHWHVLTFAKNKGAARIAGEFYINAINVMRGASASTPTWDCRAGSVRYRDWLLEKRNSSGTQAKSLLGGRLVTGGAGGIGLAISRRLLADGSVRVSQTSTLSLSHGRDRLAQAVRPNFIDTVLVDVTSESQSRRRSTMWRAILGASISLSATRALPLCPL